MGSRVYLDYAATTPLDGRVLETMLPFLESDFANASALYSEGRHAHDVVEASRRQIAKSIGSRDPYEVFFTSGGTESNNTAIKGISMAARSKIRKSQGPGHAICSSIEHKSVLEPVSFLRSLGFEVTMLDPRSDGFVYPQDLEAQIRPDTVFASVMLANNEVGTVQPIRELADVAHSHGVVFHTDAIAAAGKIPIDVASLGVDALSFTSHKIYGPKGIGALYLSKRIPFVALIHGGGQERDKRSGTYDTASIAGFAKAAELFMGSDAIGDEASRLSAMRDSLIERLESSGCGIKAAVDIPRGDVEKHIPSLAPLIFEDMESETMVQTLDDMGFAVSGGSACTSGSNKPSHVLMSMGKTQNDASGFLRITMGHQTTNDEIDRACSAMMSMKNDSQS